MSVVEGVNGFRSLNIESMLRADVKLSNQRNVTQTLRPGDTEVC